MTYEYPLSWPRVSKPGDPKADGNARMIALSRGLVAIVDERDFETVSAYKWYAHPGRNTCTPGPRSVAGRGGSESRCISCSVVEMRSIM
jgi:hypothetical protein